MRASYEPTAKKLSDARRRGEVPQSREVTRALVLLIGIFSLWFTGDALVERLKQNFVLIDEAIQNGAGSSLDVVRRCFFQSAAALMPFLASIFVVGFLASFLQVGPLFTVKAISPRASSLDPAKRLQRVFSGWKLVDLAFAFAKLVAIGCVAWITIKSDLRGILSLLQGDAQRSLTMTAKLVVDCCVRVGGVLFLFAVADFFYQRYRFRQSQKMTREEVLREQKETYGDPLIRQHRGRTYQEIIDHATLEQTARATVVVVSAAQHAVALRYEPDAEGRQAPRVIAKGEKGLAQRMMHVALIQDIPTVQNGALVEAMYRLDVGKEIPERYYEEVVLVLQAVKGS
jgi:flagellar biosynthesis protein FlhB